MGHLFWKVCVFVGSEVWRGMSVFIAERNRGGFWETEDVIPQRIKQSNFYTQKVLEGWTIKREDLVSYTNTLSQINCLKAGGTQVFSLLHETCTTSTSNRSRLQRRHPQAVRLILAFGGRTVHVTGPIKALISPLESTFFWSIICSLCVARQHPTHNIFSTKLVLFGSIISGSLAPQTQRVAEIPSVSAPSSSLMPPIPSCCASPAPCTLAPLSR